MSTITGTLTLVALALAVSRPARADVELQSFLEKALTWLQDRDHDPAIAALIQIDGQVAAVAAVGHRALGHHERVTLDDRWHIGSDTKAFTATLIGTLVDQHIMSFDDSLEMSLPALAKTMHPAYRRITVRQLLSHTAGLPPLKNVETEFPAAVAAVKTLHGITAQRVALARYYLTRPPASAAGTFEYSNLGYIIAGAIVEAHTGKSWEISLRERVFAPLGIKEAEFGPPGHPGQYDQPWGHDEVSGKLEPRDPGDPASDNPAWIGPAGTISISLKSWASFAQDQLDGAVGHGKLLQAATYRALQTPVTGGVALGWGVRPGPDSTPQFLTHEGSNGCWYAKIDIYPEQNTFILMATNFGSDTAQKSIEDLGTGLAERLRLPK